jgi:uncharacterized membrane protein
MRRLRASSKMLLFIMLTILVFTFISAHAQLTAIDDAQNSIYNAYKVIVEAYNSGANTNELIAQLNQAINFTAQAEALGKPNPQQAQALAIQAQVIAQNVTAQASTAKGSGSTVQNIILAILVVASIASGCLVYLYGPKIFWKTWLKIRKNYHVRAKTSATQKKSLVITVEQVCSMILIVTIIVAFFAVSQFLLPKGTSEQFSELGVLGSNMKLGDYPSEVVASQSVSLYVYVGNRMGTPMYYDVKIKLGDNATSVNPAPIVSIQDYQSIVPSNETWTFPAIITLTRVGLNQRIIFELWIYNQTLNQMQYHERWSQVWLNVTAPAS